MTGSEGRRRVLEPRASIVFAPRLRLGISERHGICVCSLVQMQQLLTCRWQWPLGKVPNKDQERKHVEVTFVSLTA